MAKRIEVGYVCYQGHFVFKGDEDACGTKRVGTLYAEPNKRGEELEFGVAVQESLDSVLRKIAFWRNG